MRYENMQLGFSFELPEGWRKDDGNLTLSFFGPQGRVGSTTEVIQLKIGTILPQYHKPESREIFLAEPGAEVFRKNIGDESNVVFLDRKNNGEISAVRDNIHYNFTYAKDTLTLAAIDKMCSSAKFGTPQQAKDAIANWSNPKKQAISKAIRSGSAEEARKILTNAGMPPSIERQDYSIHRTNNEHDIENNRKDQGKKWWQFWK